jgi:hypothetical protein
VNLVSWKSKREHGITMWFVIVFDFEIGLQDCIPVNLPSSLNRMLEGGVT